MHIFQELNRLKLASFVQADAHAFCERMERYVSELELFNSVYDLVAAKNRDEIITRHILDSLSALPVLAKIFARLAQAGKKNPRVADVGSGAGLPGIPLAAAFPQLSFTLIERMSKRCAFLENCAAVLGLKNVSVLQTEAEKAPHNAFDLIVFRAFRPLDVAMFKTLSLLTTPDGFLAAYKAKSAKIHEEMTALNIAWEQHHLESSFLGSGSDEHERNMVIIQVKKTPITEAQKN